MVWFWQDAAMPAGQGPVESLAFLRFASSLASEIGCSAAVVGGGALGGAGGLDIGHKRDVLLKKK